jgi:hypothetical protein
MRAAQPARTAHTEDLDESASDLAIWDFSRRITGTEHRDALLGGYYLAITR